MQHFPSFLAKKIGLNPKVVSETYWQRILRERMLMCGITDIDEYMQRLLHSPVEFQEVVELLIVPETWFFRDREGIDFFCDYACNTWRKKSEEKFMRILSLPCSTGEEPYSIAMALMDRHFPKERLRIHGIDISRKALAAAVEGVYGHKSFRTKDLGFRDRYFSTDKTTQLFTLNPSIRNLVQFSYGNLLDDNFSSRRGVFDVIFCRNLFIYFNADAQVKGLEMLKEMLAPQGMLFVAIAEAEFVRSAGFVLCGPSKAAVFSLPAKEDYSWRPLMSQAKGKKIVIASPPAIIDDVREAEATPSLVKVKQLADRGEIDEALELCHDYLRLHATDSQAYFLVGQLELARGHATKAEEYFLKTVYLDAEYYEALVYLALLADRKGEKAQAELFRTRAARCKSH